MKTTNSRYNTPNKFITLTRVTLVPATILNIVIMFLLAGFAINKKDTPDWLIVIGTLVLGVSSIAWLITSTLMFIEDVWPEIKEDLRQFRAIFKKDK